LTALTRKWSIYQDYREGSNYATWNSGFTYVADVSVGIIFSIPKLAAGNINNNPQTSPDWWELVNQYSTGSVERSKYSGGYIYLTYQLNNYFKKALSANGFFGFRQPPYPAPYDYGLGGGTFKYLYYKRSSCYFYIFSCGIEDYSSDVGINDSGILSFGYRGLCYSHSYTYQIIFPECL